MRNKAVTKDFYCKQLGFNVFGSADFDGYLMLEKDQIQLHFFEFPSLNPLENYGQVYIRTENIETVYQNFVKNNVKIHPAGHLQTKPWGQKNNIDTTDLEAKNDLMVYKLYELSYDEVLVIEPEFSLSKQEYDNFAI